MAAIRKPMRCECGMTLKTFVTISKGRIATELGAGCPKCGAVYSRPTCYGKTTLEQCRNAKTLTAIKSSLGVLCPVKELDAPVKK